MDNLNFLNKNSREFSRVEFIGGGVILKNGELHNVDILDISACGMKISHASDFKLGDKIWIMPIIHADENIEFEAEVVHKDEFNDFCGVKITTTTVASFMRLVSIIMKHDGDGSKIKSEIKEGNSFFNFSKERKLISKAIEKHTDTEDVE